LQHLTVLNALADTKAVLELALSKYPSSSGKVISFGGSYSGSLSAFLRMEYPDTVVGSISESGVVSDVLDFTAFDTSIFEAAQISAAHPTGGSAPDPCATNLQQATAAMERMVAAGAESVLLGIFNASGMQLDDFWYAVADGPAMLIQYGSKSTLCDHLAALPAGSTDKATAANLAAIISDKYGGAFVGGCFYDSRCFSSPEKSASASASPMERQWRWQKCYETAYLQAAPVDNSIRSRNLTLASLTDQCERAFGTQFGLDPRNEALRAHFGSFKPKGSNIFFLDYSDDPWRAATVDRQWVDHSPEAASRNLKSCFTTCNSCGHCGAGVPFYLKKCEGKATSWLATILASTTNTWGAILP